MLMEKLKIDPGNLDREVDPGILQCISLSINKFIYTSIHLSIHQYIYLYGGCLDEAETGLKGIDSPATFGRDGAMNIAPPPLTD